LCPDPRRHEIGHVRHRPEGEQGRGPDAEIAEGRYRGDRGQEQGPEQEEQCVSAHREGEIG
jgi:hypothetical protein